MYFCKKMHLTLHRMKRFKVLRQKGLKRKEKGENALWDALSPDFVLWVSFLHIRKTLNPLWIKRFLCGVKTVIGFC